jgi:hypothetical protein
MGRHLSPFLYSCDIYGLRVLLNLQSRNVVLQLVDSYLSVIMSSIPEMTRPPQRLLNATIGGSKSAGGMVLKSHLKPERRRGSVSVTA